MSRYPAIFTVVLSICCVPPVLGQGGKAIPQAHAHNDYLHDRPLLDALDQRFGSVEADVFLVDDELLVGHTRAELTSQRSLRALYLEPLRQRIEKHQGSVHGDGQAFTLLIDIKSEAESTYRELNRQLAEYAEVFSKFDAGRLHPGPVLAIVSGNRAVEAIAESTPRFVGIDGRLSDLESDQPVHLLPLISDNWSLNFRWRGEGEMPSEDRQKLADIVRRAHAQGRRVRLWATPDKANVWQALREANVDLINTDDLVGLSQFLSR